MVLAAGVCNYQYRVPVSNAARISDIMLKYLHVLDLVIKFRNRNIFASIAKTSWNLKYVLAVST